MARWSITASGAMARIGIDFRRHILGGVGRLSALCAFGLHYTVAMFYLESFETFMEVIYAIRAALFPRSVLDDGAI
jgi:hypothetical protein